MKSLFRNLFFCCRTTDDEEGLNNKDILNKMNKNQHYDMIPRIRMNVELPTDSENDTNTRSDRFECSNSNVEEKEDLNSPLFEDRLIRDEERLHITFTQEGLVNFVERVNNDDRYELGYNKNNFVVHFNKAGSMLNKDIYITKSNYTVKKASLQKDADVKYLAYVMYNLEERIKWDKSLKILIKIEGNDKAYVVRSRGVKPMVMIAEREVIDKRVEFYYNDVYYNISTSVPDATEQDVVRVKTFFNIALIYEDEENFYFTTITQMDFKMPLAQNIINASLPMKMAEWYTEYFKAVNSTK